MAQTAEAQFVKGSDAVYRCPAFAQLHWLHHGFSTRAADLSSQAIVTQRQIHSATVRNARDLAGRQEEGDALVSNEPNVLLGVRTADCVPILLADPVSHSVAAIHAGWRGTVARIVEHTIDRMRSDFGAHPRNILAAIGPSIGVCCYQVGREVAEQFRIFSPRLELDSDGHAMLDLVAANRYVLEASGIPASQVFISNLCTRDNEADFFSYRREPQNPGRMISYIGRIS